MIYDPKLGESWKKALLEMDTFMRQIREPDKTKPVVISEDNVWYQLKKVSTMDDLKKQVGLYVYNYENNEKVYDANVNQLLVMYEIKEKDGVPIYNPDSKEGRYYIDFDAKFPYYASVYSCQIPFKYVGINNNYAKTDDAVIEMKLQGDQLKFFNCHQWLDEYIYLFKYQNNYNILPITISKEQALKETGSPYYK